MEDDKNINIEKKQEMLNNLKEDYAKQKINPEIITISDIEEINKETKIDYIKRQIRRKDEGTA